MKKFIARMINFIVSFFNLADLISDGYHTIKELYEHRIELWIMLCRENRDLCWKSRTHSDGSIYEGWFLLGMTLPDGRQLTYHLPFKYWYRCDFVKTLEKAPEYDGHTAGDVLDRLRSMRNIMDRNEAVGMAQKNVAERFVALDVTNIFEELKAATTNGIVGESKACRKALDEVIQYLRNSQRLSDERDMSITKIQEAIMWLGMDLKDIGATPNPYPESYNAASPVVEPTADGLKM